MIQKINDINTQKIPIIIIPRTQCYYYDPDIINDEKFNIKEVCDRTKCELLPHSNKITTEIKNFMSMSKEYVKK